MPDNETIIKIMADTDDLENHMESGEKAIDRFITRIKQRGDALKRMAMGPTIGVTDKVSGKVRAIQAGLRGLKTVHRISIEAVDRTSHVIKGITEKMTSPLTLLGAGAGAYGFGKLTLGAAMDFETQQVSMEHWLKGNKEQAQQFTSWLDVLAAKTPFEMADLFPAGARSIGVSEGDLNMAKRLVSLSADMAGLTPGKTVQDAMEALADAQMGEFERMKEFNMKFTKEKMDAAGGFAGFMAEAEQKYAGGADKLSATAKGRISTITDFFKTMFRNAGQGALEAINPRLQKITDWFDKNQDQVGYWKDRLAYFGREAGENVSSGAEHFLNRLKQKFDDPGFQNLDWGSKVVALLEEAASVAIPKAAEVGTQLGARFAAGIAQGAAEAAAKDPLVAAIIGAWIGSKVPGPPVVKLVVGGSIAATPWIFRGGEEIGKHMPGTDLYVDKKVAEENNAWKVVEESSAGASVDSPIISGGEIRAKKESVWDSILNRIKGHSDGGILTRPHLGLVAEAGPEAIIPLSSRMRNRAQAIWQQTGQYLGAQPQLAAAGGITVYTGNINIQAGSQEIDYDAMALEIGWRFVKPIKQALENSV